MLNKTTVINIRGTSGCGKTTIVRNILQHGVWETWRDEHNKILAYYNKNLNWAVVGSYENTCGGCDGIKTQDEAEYRIQFLIDSGFNVLFEGLVISTITGRWGELARKNSEKSNFLFYYVNTPIEECIERVKKRRFDAGNVKPFNEENTRNRVKAIETTFQKLSQSGCYCIKESQENIMRNLYEWYGLGG